MTTRTQKRTARLLANTTGIDYREALTQVSEAITDLQIKRINYNENLRSWEISTEESNSLIEMLAERHAN